ncbi:hypothetical protein D3C75_1254430 [compost metagenome]
MFWTGRGREANEQAHGEVSSKKYKAASIRRFWYHFDFAGVSRSDRVYVSLTNQRHLYGPPEQASCYDRFNQRFEHYNRI